MIHHTPESLHAETQERLRVARRQREIAGAAAELRRRRRAERAAHPGRLRSTIRRLHRAVQVLRRAAAHSLRARNSRKA